MLRLIAHMWFVFVACQSHQGFAQDSDDSDFQIAATALSESLFLVPRADGMGGALMNHANYIEATGINPAGIGGTMFDTPRHGLRQLTFPYVAMSLNKNSSQLRSQFKEQGAENDSVIGAALLQAQAGKRQFARMSMVPSLSYGRLVAAYINDQQVAAAAQSSTSESVDLRYRGTSGFGFGASYTEPKKGKFQMGIFIASLTRSEAKGTMTFEELSGDLSTKQDALDEISATYDGMPINVGATFLINKKIRSTFAIAVQDVGGTLYTAKDGGNEDMTIDQRVSFGVSINPTFGRWGDGIFTAKIEDFSAKELSVTNKYRIGAEVNFGTTRNFRASLRTGFNVAGFSYGVGLYSGLLNLDYTSTKEDIGIKNDRVVETRSEVLLNIDLIEY